MPNVVNGQNGLIGKNSADGHNGVGGQNGIGGQKKIVVIGGGIGLSVILRGLKNKNIGIDAIVTVADDGGSSGKLMKDFDIPPPGDIRNVLISLATVDPELERLLQYRFDRGSGLEEHTIGNLLITAMYNITGDFVTAINKLIEILSIRARVLPSSSRKVTLYAEYCDGTTVKGESNIPLAKKPIRRVFIEPSDAKPLPEALIAVRNADLILLGPGSLYTSIIPNLLVPELREAIIESDAKKIFICNVLTQPGETDNYSVSNHVEALVQHVGEPFIDYVIVNSRLIEQALLEQYAVVNSKSVLCDDDDREYLKRGGYQLSADDFVKCETFIRHDEEKIANQILEILREIE